MRLLNLLLPYFSAPIDEKFAFTTKRKNSCSAIETARGRYIKFFKILFAAKKVRDFSSSRLHMKNCSSLVRLSVIIFRAQNKQHIRNLRHIPCCRCFPHKDRRLNFTVASQKLAAFDVVTRFRRCKRKVVASS